LDRRWIYPGPRVRNQRDCSLSRKVSIMALAQPRCSTIAVMLRGNFFRRPIEVFRNFPKSSCQQRGISAKEPLASLGEGNRGKRRAGRRFNNVSLCSLRN
jgi:hypothetical protein